MSSESDEKQQDWKWLLEDLFLSRYRFTFESCAHLKLPPFPGSMLRGSFGRALKETVCINQRRDCDDCAAVDSCAYLRIFVTTPDSNKKIMKKANLTPRPFLLEVEFSKRADLKASEKVSFDIWLIGSADNYAPFVIYAADRMAWQGLGAARIPCKLASARVVNPDGSTHPILKGGKAVGLLGGSLHALGKWPSGVETIQDDFVSLDFKTPLRIKREGKLKNTLPFSTFVEHLDRRVRFLASLYGTAAGERPNDKLIALSSEVRTLHSTLRWFDWERYSARQETTMKLGGLIGSIRYNGDLNPFKPLIHAGAILHIGKGTSFGLGKFVVKE